MVAVESLSGEASLDRAEELFVSCRFNEAARVCKDALLNSQTSSKCATGVLAGDEAASPAGPVAALGDNLIAPIGVCDICDLMVVVLLQCGFELRRAEEWASCHAFYAKRGAMPFAVAILWLRLRLAGGEVDLVRRVLWQLRAALGEEQRGKTTSGSTVIPDEPGGSTASARANYAETTNMLVVQVMLPDGEIPEASALITNDPYLQHEEKAQLLKACGLSANTTGDLESVSGGGSAATGGRRQAANGCSFRTTGRSASSTVDSEHAHGEALVDGVEREEPGQVNKFFANISDWSPEARLQVVVGVGTAGLAVYAACRNRQSVWRMARNAVGLARRTAGDVGMFIVGSA